MTEVIADYFMLYINILIFWLGIFSYYKYFTNICATNIYAQQHTLIT